MDEFTAFERQGESLAASRTNAAIVRTALDDYQARIKAEKKAKRADKKLDSLIDAAYNRLGNRVQVNIMDIPNIFADSKRDMAAGRTVDEAVAAAIAKYRKN